MLRKLRHACARDPLMEAKEKKRSLNADTYSFITNGGPLSVNMSTVSTAESITFSFSYTSVEYRTIAIAAIIGCG